MPFTQCLKRTLLVSVVALSLSGCIASKTSLGNGRGAMSVGDIEALIGPEMAAELALSIPSPESDYAGHGYVQVEVSGVPTPMWLYPFAEGIVAEIPPGAMLNPFYVYGAVLPHPKGAAVFTDTTEVVQARSGKKGPAYDAASQALPVIEKLTIYRIGPGGLEYMAPSNLQDVLSIYQALAEAGAEPESIIKVSKGS